MWCAGKEAAADPETGKGLDKPFGKYIFEKNYNENKGNNNKIKIRLKRARRSVTVLTRD